MEHKQRTMYSNKKCSRRGCRSYSKGCFWYWRNGEWSTGYIEGSAGVFGGQKDWDEVFQDIGADLDELQAPPDDWMSAFQSHMENDTVPYGQQELVNQILKGVFKEMGIPYHLTPEISQAIVRWGGAMIGASKDMRSQGGSKGGVAYNGSI